MKKANEITNNESGQGMIEYVLILLVVVGAVLALRGQFTSWSETASGKVSDSLESF